MFGVNESFILCISAHGPHGVSMFRILLSNVLKVVKKLKKNKKSNGSIFKNHTIAHFMHSNKILFLFYFLNHFVRIYHMFKVVRMIYSVT